MTNEAIRTLLASAAEPEYRAFSQSLLPGVNDLIGVRLPVLRRFARRLAKGDALEYLSRAADSSFEERLLQGLVLGYAPMEREARAQAIHRFLPKIDNWSICDSTCITCRFMREDPEYWWNFLLSLTQSPEEYSVRFALVCMIDHFSAAPESARRVLEICVNIRSDAYYVQMAQAWAIAECAVAAPEAALAQLSSLPADDFVRRMAIRKICESFRISTETKAAARALRAGRSDEPKFFTRQGGLP